jgi:hypothetical protein
MKAPRLRDHGWLAIPFVAVLIGYAPVWLTEYGFGEDYRLLSFYDHGATNRTLMIAEGRPVQALWTNLVFGHITGIDSLATLRFANVVLLGIVAMLFAQAWTAVRYSRTESVLAGTAVLTLAPYQVFAATGAYGIVPMGAVCAAAAALLTNAMLQAGVAWKRAVLAGSALALLVIAITGYQPACMLYWAVAGIIILAPFDELPVFRRKLKTFATIGFSAIAIGFAIYRIGRAAYPLELAVERAGLATNPGLKLLWFLMYPLGHALNPWVLHLNRPLAAATGVLLLSGLWLHLRAQQGPRLRFAVALALVPLCYLPNLVVAENWSSFRSQVALSSIVIVYTIIALRTQSGSRTSWIRSIGLPVLAAVGLVTAIRNVDRLFVRPQRQELEIVRQTLNGVPASYDEIGVIMSSERETLAPFSLYDEFGRPSTSFTWGVTNLPWLVLRELRPDPDTSAFRVYDVTSEIMPVDTVLDWGAILRTAKADGIHR